MGKKSQPQAPDPAQTIAAQSAANKDAVRESAKANAVDQYSPWGSTTYQKNAEGMPTSQTISLSDQGQRIYNGQQNIAEGLTQKAGELAGRIPTGPMDVSNLPARVTAVGSGPQMGGVSAAGADPSSLGLTTGVNVPSLQMAVASRSGELQRDINSRTGEVSNLGMQDYGAATKATQDATFGKAQSLLKPGQDLERSRLEQSLSDRGIPLDSAAGRAELTRMAQSQSEANNRSAYDAVAAGSAEQSRLFGLDATRTQINNSAAGQRFGQDLNAGQFRNDATDRAFGQDLSSGTFANNAAGQLFGMNMQNAALNNSARGQAFDQAIGSQGFNNNTAQQGFQNQLTGANFQNDQRSAALQEALALRNQDFNEASALLQGAPVMGTPSFMNTPTYSMQPVDAAGIYQQDYANRVQQSQARQANGNAAMSGLFGLGKAAMMFSDRRLKTDVQRVGTGWRGLPLYLFRYLAGGTHHVGVMAQDVFAVAPEAVHAIGRYLAVDYRALSQMEPA
ncbi:tail fiber domain-containing protein [Aureimonas sp. N4]|uniref:tail fiber domain-containing protein n=1 Tax=Aureimonas sp. N4 TaxID=1638165 RepID=UPI000784C3C3|nr:tail fiber domain-containing protein [Aureimonas sp. N4]